MTVYEFMKKIDEYLPMYIVKIENNDKMVDVTDGESTTLDTIIKHEDVREEVLNCMDCKCIKYDFLESVIYCASLD